MGAQTDRLDDSVTFSSLPTILDRLSAAGVSHRYFFSNVPFLAMWGVKYIDSSGWFEEFLERAAAGTLPAVSFVDPIYTVLDDGTGNDDHPHADIRSGDAFLAAVFHAVAGGPAWDKTVLIINFDEWGGFFEHVAPPGVTAPDQVDSDEVTDECCLASGCQPSWFHPLHATLAGTPQVNHTVFDHTSVLKLIEWRFGVPPLTARDASPLIGNFATALNFSAPNASVPTVPLPRPVLAAPCFENIVGLLTPSNPRQAHRRPRTEPPGRSCRLGPE